MCKRGDTFSLAVLIGRGLDLALLSTTSPLLLFFHCSVFRVYDKHTIYFVFCRKHLKLVVFCGIIPVFQLMTGWLSWRVGVINDEGPPVPIPNTVVKLIRAENTWWEAAWENRSVPTQTLLAFSNASSVYIVYYMDCIFSEYNAYNSIE